MPEFTRATFTLNQVITNPLLRGEQTLSGLNDVTGRSWEPELYHQRAQFLLALNSGTAGEADERLKKAIAASRSQNAKSFELRATTDLAALWRVQARFDEARILIEPIYSWFSEGVDTADLRRPREVWASLD